MDDLSSEEEIHRKLDKSRERLKSLQLHYDTNNKKWSIFNNI